MKRILFSELSKFPFSFTESLYFKSGAEEKIFRRKKSKKKD
jgi:hypothetical protein